MELRGNPYLPEPIKIFRSISQSYPDVMPGENMGLLLELARIGMSQKEKRNIYYYRYLGRDHRKDRLVSSQETCNAKKHRKHQHIDRL